LSERARGRDLPRFRGGENRPFAGAFPVPGNVKQMATVRGNERFTMMADCVSARRTVPMKWRQLRTGALAFV
jgi:hypothetical protein